MPSRSVRDFLETLANAGDLLRIDRPVESTLEIAEITRRVAASGGPALLFERAGRGGSPISTNLLGTPERLCRALGIESLDGLVDVGQACVELFHTTLQDSRQTNTGEADSVSPGYRLVKQAASQQVVRIGRDIDLMSLPALQSWPDETGPTLWGRLFYSRVDGTQSATLCRAQMLDRNRLAVVEDGFFAPGCSMAELIAKSPKANAAFVPGGLADVLLPAGSRLGSAGELLSQQLSRDQASEVAKAKTSELLVPASAEMIIEGTVDSDTPWIDLKAAAAVGDRYSPARRAVVLQVATITHRANFLLNTFVHGFPHGDLVSLHKALERLLLPMVRLVVPELVELAMPVTGGWQRCAVLSIRKTQPGQAQRTVHAFWGLPWTDHVKLTVVVDADASPHDWPAVAAELTANVDFRRDVLTREVPRDPTDHAAGERLTSRAIAIDATSKLPAEQLLAWPDRLRMPDEVLENVDRAWQELGLPARIFRQS